ncbi:MAG: ANTAR domain-containing protein [Jatrophihabitantaceae bacterium]
MDGDKMIELAQEFGELGSEIHGEGDNDAALRRLVQLAVKHIPSCVWASITVLKGKQGRSIAYTDDIAAQADQLQYECGEGPCLQAAADNNDYLLFDVERETRWPSYTAAVLERTPVRSVLSMQLPAEEAAALNLFADQAAAFGEDDLTMATVFAAHASTLVALYETEHDNENLHTALDSSRRIGAAIGVLMAIHKVTEDQAFDLLRTASQLLHRKLRDIASEVVETGALPDLPPVRSAIS